MIIKQKDINPIKMSVNPLQCIVDAEYRIIFSGKIHRYVGIGWVEECEATPDDYDIIPEVLAPHCSQCAYYECVGNYTMYCHILKRRITARKRPCKKYSEK